MEIYDLLTTRIRDPLTENLDNLRFQQDLVDEARKRIVRYCPEWTEYNVSDPGITLIELFAWMTEQIIYRLNQVPRKNYIRFLEMLGIQLEPPVAAKTELTFYLSAPFPLNRKRPGEQTEVVIPEGTQVSAMSPDSAAVTFTTDEPLRIIAPQVEQLRRPQEFPKNYWQPGKSEIEFPVFDRDHNQSSAYFYLGFNPQHKIAGYILRLEVHCKPEQSAGIDPTKPPWEWQAFVGDANDPESRDEDEVNTPDKLPGSNRWAKIDTGKMDEERDTTGGFTNEVGHLTLYLPLTMKLSSVHGIQAYWVRCRLRTQRTTHSDSEGHYTVTPVIKKLGVEVLGATTTAINAVTVENEMLGLSSGDPGQTFYLKHTPLLPPKGGAEGGNGEVVEVEEVMLHEGEQTGKAAFEPQFVVWEQVEHFADSTQHDRHYTLDPATGEVRFGPAIRQQDGAIRQYGRIPSLGMRIRMRKYRYSRGAQGNVPPHRVSVLHQSIPYVDRVTNWERVIDGRDQETLDEAMMRAQRLLRAQQRAVTATDYELLAKQNDRSIARVKCITPHQEEINGNGAAKAPAPTLAPGQVRILIVPAAYETIQQGKFSQFRVTTEMERRVRKRLAAKRLLTSLLTIQEPKYLGIFIDATIVVDHRHDSQQVANAVNRALRTYITPLRPAPTAPPHNGSTGTAQKVQIEINQTSDPVLVRAQVEAALQRLAGPSYTGVPPIPGQVESVTSPASPVVALERPEPAWDGWRFGEPLTRAELFALIQAVPGVRHVREVDMYWLRLSEGTLISYTESLDPPPDRLGSEQVMTGSGGDGKYKWELIEEDRLKKDGEPFDDTTLLCSPLNHRIRAEEL